MTKEQFLKYTNKFDEVLQREISAKNSWGKNELMLILLKAKQEALLYATFE